ncbi:HAD hydrolase-like protein [Xanthovirga aplysinae]|uniref:HAD hydrolase-like protein n=1 Tax=Xanthovirga aplysinae TaxID=2529853 RepID=UPI0012BB62E9|nr:HAD hydrolase-like protein [Xanthovirga aplysinae]MTI32036.1 carotenoid oxygenase [Xanthovirga aplysinae]
MINNKKLSSEKDRFQKSSELPCDSFSSYSKAVPHGSLYSKTSKPKILIFDFDGTLANTLNLAVEVYNSIAENFNCKKIKDEELQALRNSKPQDFFKPLNIKPWKLPLIILKARAEIHKRKEEIQPVFHNLFEILFQLKEFGYKCLILTSNSKKNVSYFLQKHNLCGIFEKIYTTKHLFGKHKVLKKILKNEGLDKSEFVFLGDESRDIEAAQKLSIKMIAVSWGYQSEKILSRCQPDFLVNQPGDLTRLLMGKTI